MLAKPGSAFSRAIVSYAGDDLAGSISLMLCVRKEIRIREWSGLVDVGYQVCERHILGRKKCEDIVRVRNLLGTQHLLACRAGASGRHS